MQDNCEFCLRLNHKQESRPWYDFCTLGRSANFCTIVALGALAPGHVMIVSNRHVERMADLDSASIRELNETVNCWTRLMSRIWSLPCFWFEHGGRSLGNSVGSCVPHAHFQILPLAIDPMSDYIGFHRLSSLIEALSYTRRSGYLLFRWREDLFVSTERTERGQFFRRHIANALDRPDEWDYLMFPNYEAMRETRERIRAVYPD